MLDNHQENDRESLGYLLGISTLYFLRASVQYKFPTSSFANNLKNREEIDVSSAGNIVSVFSFEVSQTSISTQ